MQAPPPRARDSTDSYAKKRPVETESVSCCLLIILLIGYTEMYSGSEAGGVWGSWPGAVLWHRSPGQDRPHPLKLVDARKGSADLALASRILGRHTHDRISTLYVLGPSPCAPSNLDAMPCLGNEAWPDKEILSMPPCCSSPAR